MTQTHRKPTVSVHWIVTCGVALVLAQPGWAQTRVVSIEEHWSLQLGHPDQDRSAPQVTMVLSPDADLGGVHFQFTINHVSVPQYTPGGMQLQVWDGEQLLDDNVADESGTFAHANEAIHWVQRLTLNDNTLTFKVLDGESETWGDFGGENLSVSVASSQDNLNLYRPGVSLTESQVGYAENRVEALTLTKLIWITDDGEVHELNAPIAVDTSLDP